MERLLQSCPLLSAGTPWAGTAPGVATAFTRAAKVAAATLTIVLLLSGSALQGAVVISNLPNSNDGGSTISDTAWKAVVFKTGSQPTLLSAVTVGLNPDPTTDPVPKTQNVTVSFYSVSNNTPNTLLATTGLTPVTMSARQGLYSFNSIAGTAMEASTAYALVLSSDLSKIKCGSNGSNTNEPTTANGFEYINFVQSSNSGASWTNSLAVNNAFSIDVVPIPEPGTWAAMAIFAGGAAYAGWRRRKRAKVS